MVYHVCEAYDEEHLDVVALVEGDGANHLEQHRVLLFEDALEEHSQSLPRGIAASSEADARRDLL